MRARAKTTTFSCASFAYPPPPPLPLLLRTAVRADATAILAQCFLFLARHHLARHTIEKKIIEKVNEHHQIVHSVRLLKGADERYFISRMVWKKLGTAEYVVVMKPTSTPYYPDIKGRVMGNSPTAFRIKGLAHGWTRVESVFMLDLSLSPPSSSELKKYAASRLRSTTRLYSHMQSLRVKNNDAIDGEVLGEILVMRARSETYRHDVDSAVARVDEVSGEGMERGRSDG